MHHLSHALLNHISILTPRKVPPLTHPAHIDEEGNEATRPLGLVVARGTLLVVITPVDGSEQIANPFAAPEE